jgi:hypothetical protein
MSLERNTEGRKEERRPPERQRRRLVNNIKIDPVEIDGMVFTGLIWPRIGTRGVAMKLCAP